MEKDNLSLVIAMDVNSAQYYSELHRLLSNIKNISITGVVNDVDSVLKLIDVQHTDVLIVDCALFQHGLNEIIQNAHNHNLDTYIIEFNENKENEIGFDAYLYKLTKSFNLTNILTGNGQPKTIPMQIETKLDNESLYIDYMLQDKQNAGCVRDVNEPVKLDEIKKIQDGITYLFKLLGVPSHLKGYMYLKAAVEMLYVNPHRYNELKHSMYKLLAFKFQTTQIRISKGMRLAVLQTLQKGNADVLQQLGFRKYTITEIGNDEHKNNLPSTYCFVDALVSELYRILHEH
ncbi:MAG: hypothetical protein GX166_09950 [Clostridiaceae bacterium]|nr:hypothetical protein [Clostridiaceae bacterium]